MKAANQWADLEDVRSIELRGDIPKGVSSLFPREWLRLCFNPPLRGPWVFLEEHGTHPRASLVAVMHWEPRWQLASLCASRYHPVRSIPRTARPSRALSAPLGELWFIVSLLGSRKSDSFTSQHRQGNAFPRLLTWQGGREPEHLHPLAKDHEEMFNWHLGLSSGAGWGSQALLHPMQTSLKDSRQYLVSSSPNPCGVLSSAVPHWELCPSFVFCWNSWS